MQMTLYYRCDKCDHLFEIVGYKTDHAGDACLHFKPCPTCIERAVDNAEEAAKAGREAIAAEEAEETTEDTEDTVTTENRLDMTDDRLSGIGKVLSNQTERLTSVGGLLSCQDQRLKVVESTLAASEDARESMDMRISSLAANISSRLNRVDALEEKFAAAEKEAEAETDGMEVNRGQ